ncbi:hypothetical protein F5878DRAFT_669579 [Lentinula raphanica]|uniref:Uncharacterized protein n=1 Tax=Lentinula raphanica TaxID=153919 RepID=A0AA38UK36_9AGAR|nr:hypothetical protein F5878DRAFT_669579 [Lentinula raphanica]
MQIWKSIGNPRNVAAAPQRSCPGTNIQWDSSIGTVAYTYPFLIHDPISASRPGYEIISFDSHSIKLRSNRCSLRVGGSVCRACLSIQPAVDVVLDQARQPPGTRQRTSLSYKQLLEKLEDSDRDKNKLRTKIFDLERDLKTARETLSQYETLLDYIGEHEVPALLQIFRTRSKSRWGLKEFSRKIHGAVENNSRPHNYSPSEIDLALLMYELGGKQVLHALHKAPTAFPSLTFLNHHRRSKTRLKLSVGEVTMQDILMNIEMIWKAVKPTARPTCMALSQDEVASDPRFCWIPETDEIGGVCEHASKELRSLKMGTDLTAIEELREAVKDGRVHIAREVSVLAFARQSDTNYGAKPAVILPTCKQGDFIAAARLLWMTLEAWRISPYGQALHGPCPRISSDGDPKRRPAMHLICMARNLCSDDPLFEFLEPIPGMNLRCGPNMEFMDFDVKHDFKRVCKTLCSAEGMLVMGVPVDSIHLARWFEYITELDWTEASINSLLKPSDLQDVPRAIKLICTVADLRWIDNTQLNPSEMNTFRALTLLGDMFSALVLPFVDPTLSLSQQIIYLSKFAHIACKLYSTHGSAFLPHQLYGDLMTMACATAWQVAWVRSTDPVEGRVLLMLMGDDVLLFA